MSPKSFASPLGPRIFIVLIALFAFFTLATQDSAIYRNTYNNNLPVIYIVSPRRSSYISNDTIEYQVNITDRDGINDISQVKISWCLFNGTELEILYNGDKANNTGTFNAPIVKTGLEKYRFKVEAWDQLDQVMSERIVFVGKNSKPTLHAWIYPQSATELVNDTLSVKIEYNSSDIDGNLQAVDIVIFKPVNQSSTIDSDISKNYSPAGVYFLVGKEYFTITGTKEGLEHYTIRVTARDLDNDESFRILWLTVNWINSTETNNSQSSGIKQMKDYTTSSVPNINIGEILLVFLFYCFFKKLFRFKNTG